MLPLLLYIKRKRGNYEPASAARWKGILRLAAFTTVTSCVLGAVMMHNANADAAKGALAFGRDMSAYMGDENATEIKLNDQSMFTAMILTDEKHDKVLDRFEEECANNSGGLSEMWKTIAADSSKKSGFVNPIKKTGVIRQDDKDDG